jgi:uncharacterized repeat protein (TIGR01451 family)
MLRKYLMKYIDIHKRALRKQKSKLGLYKFVRNISQNSGLKKSLAVVGIFSLLFFTAGALPLTTKADVGPSITIDTINGQSGPFNFNCNTSPLFNPVSVTGHGAGSAPPGDASQYKVQVDWGDGHQTNGLGIFTPNSGHVPFTYTFTTSPSNDHSYTSTGNFTIKARLYHESPPGHDNQADSVISVTICVHVPPSTKGSLTLTKVVVNNDGGSAQISNYTLKVGATTVTSGVVQDFSAASGTGTSYAITETGPGGYTASFSGNCDSNGNITIHRGQVYFCTLTNDDNAAPPQPGTLTVIKHVINDDQTGSSVASGFTLNISGGNPSPASVTGNENGVAVTIDANGSYSVTEPTAAGYLTSYSTDCSGTMPAGGQKTCIVTNDDLPLPPPTQGNLVVVKNVTNDNGGTQTAGSFQIIVNDGSNDLSPVSPVGNDQSVTYTYSNLLPGPYTVSEGDHTGYASDMSLHCGSGAVTVLAGQTTTCTIMNDDIAPSLTLVKQLGGDGNASVTDWTLTATGDQQVPTVLSGPGGATSDGTFQAGTYTLSETGSVANYNNGQAWDCGGDIPVTQGNQITLGVGVIAICTITNTFVAPSADLVISKDIDNNSPHSGDTVIYTITVTNNGPDVANNVSVSDPLLSGLSYVSDDGSGGAYDTNTKIWTIGDLAVGSGNAVTLHITATVSGNAGDTIVNEAIVTGDPNIDLSNDKADASLTIAGSTGGCTENCGGGGGGNPPPPPPSGGGGGSSTPPPNPNLNTPTPTPAPSVAGAQTPTPQPQVAGATTLPRTGADIADYLLFLSLSLIAPWMSKQKAKPRISRRTKQK